MRKGNRRDAFRNRPIQAPLFCKGFNGCLYAIGHETDPTRARDG